MSDDPTVLRVQSGGDGIEVSGFSQHDLEKESTDNQYWFFTKRFSVAEGDEIVPKFI